MIGIICSLTPSILQMMREELIINRLLNSKKWFIRNPEIVTPLSTLNKNKRSKIIHEVHLKYDLCCMITYFKTNFLILPDNLKHHPFFLSHIFYQLIFLLPRVSLPPIYFHLVPSPFVIPTLFVVTSSVSVSHLTRRWQGCCHRCAHVTPQPACDCLTQKNKGK